MDTEAHTLHSSRVNLHLDTTIEMIYLH